MSDKNEQQRHGKQAVMMTRDDACVKCVSVYSTARVSGRP